MEQRENRTNDEKKKALFYSQKETLDLFLKNGALSKEQYTKSLTALAEKLGVRDYTLENGERK